MPEFEISDPSTGRTLTIEGDSEPSESEIHDLFAATAPIPTTQPFYAGESTIAGAPGRNPLVGTPAIWENLGGPKPHPSRAIAEALIGQSEIRPEESVIGLSPERVMTGPEMTQATGIPKFATIPFSASTKALAGLGQFLTSPQGGVETGVAAIPGIGLVQRAKFIYDMAKGTGETAGNLAAEIDNARANPDQLDADAWQRMAEETANTALQLYGAGKLSSHEFSRITGVRAPLGRFVEREKTRISKDVAEQLLRTVRDEQLPLAEDLLPVPGLIPPGAPRELGIRTPTTEPFLQPGVPDLADAALREYMRTTVAPGPVPRPAAQALRLAVEPPAVSPEQIALAERIQGGGQAPYGKTSFMREAEAPTAERTQAATQAERDMLQSVVDEAAAQGVEIPKANLPPGVSYRRPKVAPTLSEQEKRQARESVGQGLTQESGYYTDEPRTQPLPEPEPQPERTREGVTIVSPETGRAIEKPIPLSALQRSRLRAALARGASEETILNILRLKEREPAQPQRRKENSNALEPTPTQPVRPLREEPGQGPSEVPPEENRPPTDEGGGGVTVEAPKPASPGGGASALTPEQQAISRANNGRKAFAEAMGVPYIEGESNADFLKRVAEKEKPVDIPEKKVSESKGEPVRETTGAGVPETSRGVSTPSGGAEKVPGAAATSTGSVPEGRELGETTAGTSVRPAIPETGVATGNGRVVRLWKAARRVGDVKEGPSLGTFLTDSEQTARSLADLKGEVENVSAELNKPLEIKPKSGKEYIDSEEFNKMLSDAGVKYKARDIYSDDEVWRVFDEEGKPLVNAIKKAGYDSVQFPEFLGGKDQTTTLLLDHTREGDVFKSKKVTKGVLDTAIQNIESLQSKLRKGPQSGQTLMGVPSAILDTALEAARLALKAGKTVAEAIEAAMKHIRFNVEKGKYDEAKVRQMFERELGTAKPDAEAVAGARGTAASEETKSSDNGPSKLGSKDVGSTPGTLAESERMRNLSARGTQAESVPPKVREELKTDPRSFYPQQAVPKVVEVASKMSDAELAAVDTNSDIYTAAKLELINRAFKAGNDKAATDIYQQTAADLTRMGQVINQAKLLQGLMPENIVKVVNQDLRKNGKDPLTEKQAGELKTRSKERIDSQRKVDEATEEWTKAPTDENAKKADAALTEANRAALDEQRLVHRYQGRSMASLLKAILQGNLLTPISQVANLVGNVSFLPFRISTRAIATGVDMLDSFLRDRPRQVTMGNTIETIKGAARAMKQVPDILLRGQDEAIKGEPRAGLHPLRAWATQFAKEPQAPTEGGKLSTGDRLKLAIEGTFGMTAEPMLRGLSAGDQPFRGAARARLISEQAKLKGVPKDRMDMAQKFPELFFDRKTLDQINDESLAAVFQRRSTTINHLLSWIKSKGDAFDFMVSTVAPYKLTPWNIISEIMSFAPPVSLLRAVAEARKGNIRNAEMNIGKAIVGGMMIASAQWMYKKGVVAPSLDSQDEQQKARILSGEVLPPNHINLSGLNRAMHGGDGTFKKGDKTVDFFRGGGLYGSVLYLTANVGRDLEKKPESTDQLESILQQSALEGARFTLNQSFLKGTATMLDAVQEGNADNAVQAWLNSMESIPLPNTLTAISRAGRENKIDLRGDTIPEKMLNPLKARLGFAGLDDQMNLKRGLWGEPLRETPKDANALIYHFFDITKGHSVTDDATTLELYRLWRKTADTKVIPTPPGKTMTMGGTTYNLTPTQQGQLQEQVGKARKEIADRIVLNPSYQKLPDDLKIKILSGVYDDAADAAKAKFWVEHRKDLKAKEQKAGFQ